MFAARRRSVAHALRFIDLVAHAQFSMFFQMDKFNWFASHVTWKQRCVQFTGIAQVTSFRSKGACNSLASHKWCVQFTEMTSFGSKGACNSLLARTGTNLVRARCVQLVRAIHVHPRTCTCSSSAARGGSRNFPSQPLARSRRSPRGVRKIDFPCTCMLYMYK